MTQGYERAYCQSIYYFGGNCPEPAASWAAMKLRVPDRYIAYGSASDEAALEAMVDHLQGQGHESGVHGKPCIW